ncbi:hypothetical protein C0995_012876, partial [Termitomyces sp. Mi166
SRPTLSTQPELEVHAKRRQMMGDGVSELFILDEIMTATKIQEELADMPKPFDYFDLIRGIGIEGYALG